MNDRRTAELISFVRKHSPFYRELYADLPDGVSELAALPITDHTAYWNAHGMDKSHLLTGPHTEGLVFKSGGTTGSPKVAVYTRDEWRAMCRLFGTALPATGLRAGDRVANLFYAGELYSSFVFTYDLLQEAPVPTVQLPIAGSSPLDFTVAALRDFSATVIAAPPTALCRLARHVIETAGPLLGIRLALFSGEAFYDDQLALLTEAFPNITARSIGYASVDAGILAGSVIDDADTRVHEVFTADKVVELIDPETGEPVTETDRPGRVVATDLARRLMPVIRYPVGDIAEWTDYERRRFRLLGRSEEGARVGVVTVYLEDLRAAVAAVDEDGTVAGMQVVLRHRDGRDELTIRMASDATADPARVAERDVLESALLRGLAAQRPMLAQEASLGNIHPLAVEWVAPDGLAINARTGKQLRLLDERA
ncbi:phenylacetate--CoA ligase family protein [Streptomyces sp. AK02-04a]|uniref:phenylacetate--CoA ligase family protein n=1 Tax=Streptomyces sp. AK02-04a TaxID=3028649 RepID=UPI0029A4694F|nr:phenylacetate--CoA ligase family protein [Streptomyces sp. AK02-04a]MDX3762792.1 phenylacetate--CoA ligase family protein [Streptomyces sp. AK02-04a]